MLIGRCHCGAVTWRYFNAPSSVTACNCTFCAKAGVLWIYGIEGETLSIQGPTRAFRRKDQGALEFHRCDTCGNTICWKLRQPNDHGQTDAALNIRLADTPDTIMDLPIRRFDGLNSFKALSSDGKTVRDLWF